MVADAEVAATEGEDSADSEAAAREGEEPAEIIEDTNDVRFVLPQTGVGSSVNDDKVHRTGQPTDYIETKRRETEDK